MKATDIMRNEHEMDATKRLLRKQQMEVSLDGMDCALIVDKVCDHVMNEC